MAPVIPPVPDESLAPAARELIASLPPLNLFRVLANTPQSLRPFLELGGSILAGSGLSPRLREIAILRVAHATRAPYEWAQHTQLAPEAGVGEREIELIGRDDGPDELEDAEARLVCRVADEISRDVRLSDEALQALLDRYGQAGTAEIVLCASYYNMVSRFLESARVEIEAAGLLRGQTPAAIVARAQAPGQ